MLTSHLQLARRANFNKFEQKACDASRRVFCVSQEEEEAAAWGDVASTDQN